MRRESVIWQNNLFFFLCCLSLFSPHYGKNKAQLTQSWLITAHSLGLHICLIATFFHFISNVQVSRTCHIRCVFSLLLFSASLVCSCPGRNWKVYFLPRLFLQLFLQTFFIFLKQNPAKQPFAQTLPHTLLPPSPRRQPTPHIELETAILEDNMGKAGSVALPKATCQADSHSDIYIVIPLLIALNIFIEGNWKAGWGEKWRNLWQPALKINSLFNYRQVHRYCLSSS